ncbi:MAG: hypothetical protein Q9215_000009 [Flavoplaca cf. flavocitrina]
MFFYAVLWLAVLHAQKGVVAQVGTDPSIDCAALCPCPPPLPDPTALPIVLPVPPPSDNDDNPPPPPLEDPPKQPSPTSTPASSTSLACTLRATMNPAFPLAFGDDGPIAGSTTLPNTISVILEDQPEEKPPTEESPTKESGGPEKDCLPKGEDCTRDFDGCCDNFCVMDKSRGILSCQ